MPSNMPSTALRLLVKTLFSMIIQIIPKQLQENILAKLGRVMWNFSSQMTLVIDEYDELSSINEVFEASQIYLRARTTTSVQELKVSRTAKEEELSVRINKVEKIIDTYEGIQLVWQITNKGKCQSIKLSFCDKYKEKVLSSYLPYVLERSKAIKKETKIVKLYFLWVDGSLRPLNFGHPSTFDTLAMDPPLKKELIDDLDSLGGKAWKRGYLVDGPSGTGKSSLVAAMANYLKFDIYAFELTSRLMSNSELTSLLLSTTKSSIIVIEDIDCSELQNRPDQSDSQKTLGLLDFIDGVWSACGEERIVVITTKDKLHNPTLLSRESMYVHIHMSYCNFCGFKFLASNYLDITNHYMFPEIENLLMEVEVTQADVAKELMKGDGADIALRGLTQLLKMKRIECGPGSVSENQQQQINTTQELNCLPLQQKQSQDDCQRQQAKAEQSTVHFPQIVGMQTSEQNPSHALEPERTQNLESESQYPKLQKMGNQQSMTPEQAINPTNRSKQVPFAQLLPVIQPQLDKDKAMQLQTLYYKLKKSEISKDGFVRLMRNLVGDQMLKMAVFKLQAQAARNSHTEPNQISLQSQTSAQQHNLKMPSISAKQLPDPQSFAQVHRKGITSHIASLAAQLKIDSSNASMDNNAQKPREVERQSDSHGMQVSQMSSSSLSTLNQERERAIQIQGLINLQQQQLHFPQSSFPMFGNTGGNYHPFSGANVNASTTSLKQQPHDSQIRQVPVHQSMGATQLGTVTQTVNVMSVPKFERKNSFSEPKRVHGGTLSHLTNNSTLQQNSMHWQSSSGKEQKNSASSSMTYVKQEPVNHANEQQQSQLSMQQGLSAISSAQVEQGNAILGTSKDGNFEMQSSRMEFSTSTSMVPSNSVSSSITTQLTSRFPSATSPLGPGSNVKTHLKKPHVGQKKPLEALSSSPPLSSKKQKLSGGVSLDQSIEQLNDVTAVSGVNLREEEEQLLSGPKEDSRVSEASRRVVQEEEEKLILQNLPLQKKLTEIITKYGVKSISNDVERCLSLCVEERMRGLISSLIRLSKQRVDIEKPRHRIVITSDVREQIMIMNRKAREEWEKKQSDAEKLQKLNEPEGDPEVDDDKEKDEGRVKSFKGNKEEDDKMRTTAANVAARVAVGGDDMLSKWQLMAEQARQKREGGTDAASGSQPGKDVSHKPLSTSGRNGNDNLEAEKRVHSATVATSGLSRKFGRNQVAMPQPRISRSISIKDVIAALEREPQTSKSTLMYRLYEKLCADAVAE